MFSHLRDMAEDQIMSLLKKLRKRKQKILTRNQLSLHLAMEEDL